MISSLEQINFVQGSWYTATDYAAFSLYLFIKTNQKQLNNKKKLTSQSSEESAVKQRPVSEVKSDKGWGLKSRLELDGVRLFRKEIKWNILDFILCIEGKHCYDPIYVLEDSFSCYVDSGLKQGKKQLEGYLIVQMRDDVGVDWGSSSGDGAKWMD